MTEIKHKKVNFFAHFKFILKKELTFDLFQTIFYRNFCNKI